jgi:hypothetical protein
VVTVVEEVSPAAGDVRETGSKAYEHAAPPSCVTVNVCPATLSVPVRSVVPVLGATSNVTVPLPEPLPPLMIVIQAAWLTAVHTHELPAVTAVDEVSPPAGEVRAVEASV